jgi:glutathione synthase/RimK-type ligase-like ATP-grasp enzyme
MKYDITILTDRRYVAPERINNYIANVLLEDNLVKNALEHNGLKVCRTNWDNPEFDWSETKYVLFRTTWDYFDRFEEFMAWLNRLRLQTRLINDYQLIRWNIDKSYLFDLQKNQIPIPPSVYIQKGDKRRLKDLIDKSWKKLIIKPAIAGAARETYLIDASGIDEIEAKYRSLINEENMIIQEYQHEITSKGEISLMLFGDHYSHAVLKKAKKGDFRVQDDFGGTVHPYHPSADEIKLAKDAFKACISRPVYGRVDMMWDNSYQLCVSELELIEPELWFRESKKASKLLADAIIDKMSNEP